MSVFIWTCLVIGVVVFLTKECSRPPINAPISHDREDT